MSNGGTDDDDKTVLRPPPRGGDKTVIRPAPGGDKTVLRPRPGGRGGAGPAPAGVRPGARPVPRPSAAYQPPVAVTGSGLNPLVDAATTLLSLVAQLRNTMTHPDANGLRRHVVQEVKAFENNARAAGASSEAVAAARYSLCTFLDEVVLSTPWGSESPWSKQTLLSTFYNETWGGEKFFQILDRIRQEPARNLDLLELMYICLSLGFEGKYRVLDRGRGKLEEIRDEVFRTVRGQRGDFERDLSPHWQGIQDRRNALVRYVPLWVVASLAGALLVATYLGFNLILKNTSAPVYQELNSIGTGTPAGTGS